MATRKKTASKRSSRKKTTAGAVQKKTARKVTRKKTTAKKATAKVAKATPSKAKASPRGTRAQTAPKPAARAKAAAAPRAAEASATPRARKVAAPKPPPPSPAQILADKIVAATSDPKADFTLLYTEDCVSCEPRGDAAIGFDGLAAKAKQWGDMQKRSTWNARNVFVKGDTICIEWQAEVELRDGRTLDFQEIAIHTVRDGKIAEERYFYDPGVFELPAAVEGEAPAPPPKLEPPRPAARPIETTGTPPVDPIDL